MAIYIVMQQDRHTDTKAFVFSTEEKAIAFAQSVIDDNEESQRYVDYEDSFMSVIELKQAGWLFFGQYSVEGDCVCVVKSEIDSTD